MSTNAPNFELPSSQSSKSGMTATTIFVILLVCLLGLSLICSGLFSVFVYPTLIRNRDIARQVHCSNVLKQIALAIQNYESDYKELPPAYTVDAAGNRLHSWRTLILPYLGQRGLYSRIDLSKPWDDPANAFLKEVDMYRCPSTKVSPGMTTYQVIDDPSSAFPGDMSQKSGNITDGLSNTIFVFESDDANAVYWAEPRDQTMTGYLSAVKGAHRSGRNVVLGDGSSQYMKNGTDKQVLKGLATCREGETVELNNK